jgi:UDP-N-acetyl-D-galactosamine dehydrogenase
MCWGNLWAPDPYYLTHKADMLGYHSQVITAGRRINGGMGKFVAEQTVKQMIAMGSYVKGAKVGILGLTFKENCADLRNSKVVDITRELQSYKIEVFVCDPEADPNEALREYGIHLRAWDDLPRADAIVVAVAHHRFLVLDTDNFTRKLIKGGAFIDVKAMFDATRLRAASIGVWRL